MIFHLLYLQVRNNLNMSENARNKKKLNSEVVTIIQNKFWQNDQILKSLHSVSNFQSRRVDEVSVLKF